MTARCPPTSLQKNAAHEYDIFFEITAYEEFYSGELLVTSSYRHSLNENKNLICPGKKKHEG